MANRDEFFQGRDAIVDFLRRKWSKELEYRLRKELWCFHENRISVRSSTRATTRRGSGGEATETSTGEFDELGYMRRRDARINDYRIDVADRRIHVDRD